MKHKSVGTGWRDTLSKLKILSETCKNNFYNNSEAQSMLCICKIFHTECHFDFFFPPPASLQYSTALAE